MVQYSADGSTNYELYFFYDSLGTLSVIQYYLHSGESVTGYTYYVMCNSSGDVLGLYGGDGVLRVSYEYDAWGNVISVKDANGNDISNTNSIAHRNPIRYRGYYYDTDLELYYLQSRYYDSTICRFINADAYITTGQGVLSHNMFAYCMNNPVNMCDPTGDFPWLIAALVFIGVCVVVGGVLGACADEPLIKKSRDEPAETNKNQLSINDISTSAESTTDLEKNSQDGNNTENAIIKKQNLTTLDRVTNVFIGATLGLAVGGVCMYVL